MLARPERRESQQRAFGPEQEALGDEVVVAGQEGHRVIRRVDGRPHLGEPERVEARFLDRHDRRDGQQGVEDVTTGRSPRRAPAGAGTG